MQQDEYVTFSAAWFTLSLINAGLAQAKGRRGLPWWLASLFIGPLATFLIVVWPPGGAPSEAAPGTTTQTQALVVGGVILLVLLGVGALVMFTRS